MMVQQYHESNPMTERADLIRSALDVWAPTYPRRVSRRQWWAESQGEAVRQLLDAEGEAGNSPFISTYAFPRGHTKEGNVPNVDTLFIDFDMESGDYTSGSGNREAWLRDLSFLLVRVRKVARLLLGREATGWRASLSGHKGVHLFLDFPLIPPTAGELDKFLAGVNNFARELTSDLMQETSISDLGEYIDVTSSDLGRLHRVPNTLHEGASESFGEPRYCVPVTLEELADMTPERYAEVTTAPRPVPYDSRVENETAGSTIKQHVVHAQPAAFSGQQDMGGPNYADYEKYKTYVQEIQNDAIELDDVQFLTKDRPCVWHFHERKDKFDHGYQSHYMEVYVIREMQEHNVPVSVMKEFLSNSPKYDEQLTETMIKNVISYDYGRFSVRRHMERAPEFCALHKCKVCQQAQADVDTMHESI